jgi:sterol desaturase/sphingolipid hydroxylase (fatty acid hydroxylase superfamily)
VMHRLMHAPLLWHTHRFHHSPTQLYWFSGNRGTPAHVAMFVVPQVALAWLIRVPPESLLVLVLIGQIMNNMMHTNWNIDARWQRALEWIITTPRYHAIHHATDPALAGKNIASILTIWDRLFGTYVNPDHVKAERLEFGADVETVPRYRMVFGV